MLGGGGGRKASHFKAIVPSSRVVLLVAMANLVASDKTSSSRTVVLSPGEKTNVISRKSPFSLTFGLNSFFLEEALASYVDNLVGFDSSAQFKSLVDSASCSITGWEVDVLKVLMLKAMDNLKIPLVGKFLAFRPNIEVVFQWAASTWNLKGSVTINAMPRGIFMFSFVVYEDMLKFLTRGPWDFGPGFKKFLSL